MPPATVEPGRTGGSLAARSGAVAASAAGDQSPRRMSIRFIPAPSPVSMAASAPARTEAKKEETRWTRLVRAQAAGSCLAKRRICGPVKRGVATEPVRSQTAWFPPSAAAISAHSAAVEESIQIGEVRRERTGAILAASEVAREPSASAAS